MAIATLKNAGVTDPAKLDESKTETVLLASEKIGKDPIYKKDLYQLVYEITFHEKSGAAIQVITSSQAGPVECSMGEVTVYAVSQKLK